MRGRGRGAERGGGATWRGASGTSTYRPPHARQSGRDGPISRDGLRKATGQVGRQLSEMELLLSPSRGEGSAGQGLSLTDRATQEKFRDHIDRKIDRLAREFPPGGSAQEGARRREEVGIVLLDLRKLREGLTATRRVDGFTVKVYVDSIRLSVEADNLPQLGATLPHFVFDILPQLALPASTNIIAADELSGTMESLSLRSDSQARVDQEMVAFYQSLYLLYLICHLADLASYHSTLATFTNSPASQPASGINTSPTSTAYSSAPPLHAHLAYTQRVFAALAATNYVAFSRLVPAASADSTNSPTSQAPSSLHLVVARLAIPRLREQAWTALAKSYKVFTDYDWLGRALLFAPGDEEGVKAYLKGKGIAVE